MNSQAALSEGPISAPTGRHLSGAPLIGSVGQEFVQAALTLKDPVTAVNEIQSRTSLSDPRCRPLLGLLDQLGLSRADSHKYIVTQAVESLLARIPYLVQDQLLSLLEETFPFISISELRAVPLAVLDKLQPVPAIYLKQLASREVFWNLPLGVQRQAWELDRKLLRTHALSFVAKYTCETATWLQVLNMDQVLNIAKLMAQKNKLKKVDADSENKNKKKNKRKRVLSIIIDSDEEEEEKEMTALQEESLKTKPRSIITSDSTKLPQLARRNLRQGSAALRQLIRMIGQSVSVFKGIVDLITVRFRESGTGCIGIEDAALCALRSQILMALYDDGQTSIAASDPCNKLAWMVDVCLKEKSFSPKHVAELKRFFKNYIESTDSSNKPKKAASSGKRGAVQQYTRQRKPGRDDDAESAGVPGAGGSFQEDPLRELGAAGMILRDPAVFHLMLQQVVSGIEQCVDAQSVPKDSEELVFMTQLLSLSIGVRKMLRDQKYEFPEEDREILGTMYPLIAELVLDAKLAEVVEENKTEESDDDSSDDDTREINVLEPKEEMIVLMVNHEIGRRIVQAYALKRLALGDVKTGTRVLLAIQRCLGYMSVLSIPEFAPFAFTLARRMASLLAEGRVTTSSSLWRIALEGVLLRLVDSETEAHEEILRLLLAVASDLEPSVLGKYLATALANSLRSRREHAKRVEEEETAGISHYPMNMEFTNDGKQYGTSSMMNHEDLLSDRYGGASPLARGGADRGFNLSRGADGVKGTYALFLTKNPGLNKTTAPELMEYLGFV